MSDKPLLDLSELSFDEFVSFFFDHDIDAEENWYQDPALASWNDFDEEAIRSPRVIVGHMARLFTNFANIAPKFSLEQINAGIWAMFTNQPFRLQKHLWLLSTPSRTTGLHSCDVLGFLGLRCKIQGRGYGKLLLHVVGLGGWQLLATSSFHRQHKRGRCVVAESRTENAARCNAANSIANLGVIRPESPAIRVAWTWPFTSPGCENYRAAILGQTQTRLAARHSPLGRDVQRRHGHVTQSVHYVLMWQLARPRFSRYCWW
jgi:hypothetical protein